MKQSHHGFVFVNENSPNLNSSGPWWKPGVEIFSEVSTWIVVPIILALIFGKMLDTHFGTKPIIFIILVGFAFIFSCWKIVRVIKDYMKKLQNTDKK